MNVKFLKADFRIDFQIPEELSEYLEKYSSKTKTFALFSSIQFVSKLTEIKNFIEDKGFNVIIVKPVRANFKGQVLGCDSFSDSLNLDFSKIDGFIYIGDGYFHPNALILAQEHEEEIKPVIVFNPIQNLFEVIGKDVIEKYLKKKKGNLARFYTSSDIGVFVSSKWGQEYKDSALKLRAQYPEKNFYFFVADNFAEFEFENFPFVDCWVNTACPRIGQDDITRHTRPVVNLKDVWKFEFKDEN